MQLSPQNFFGICAHLDAASGDDGDQPEEVVMYRCRTCCELHDSKEEAKTCCEPTSGTICPVCGRPHSTHRNAADCCLWKDIDAYSRWQIADAVEAGGEWAQELGLRIQ